MAKQQTFLTIRQGWSEPFVISSPNLPSTPCHAFKI